MNILLNILTFLTVPVMTLFAAINPVRVVLLLAAATVILNEHFEIPIFYTILIAYIFMIIFVFFYKETSDLMRDFFRWKVKDIQ